jgi:hypothetical protein
MYYIYSEGGFFENRFNVTQHPVQKNGPDVAQRLGQKNFSLGPAKFPKTKWPRPSEIFQFADTWFYKLSEK